MPTCLPSPFKRKKPRSILSSFKKQGLLAFILFSPLFFNGQSLTGLWVGTVSNDSVSSRKDQSLEIALTEYKDKVYGYSRSEFIVNDTLYYIVKRVKGKIEGDICEVVDDEIISYNFLGKLDKGIKVTSTFRRNKSDSSWYLAGTWKTNATKKYYSVGGKVDLGEEKDLTASKLFPHLEELNLANEVAFYKERVEGNPVVKLAKPEKIKTEYFSSTFTRDDTPLPVNALNEIKRADIKQTETAPVEKFTAANNTNLPRDTAEDESIHSIAIDKLERPSHDLPRTDIRKAPASDESIKPAEVQKTIAKTKPADVAVTIDETRENKKTADQTKTTGSGNTVNPVVTSTTKSKPVEANPPVSKPAVPAKQLANKPTDNKNVNNTTDKNTQAKEKPAIAKVNNQVNKENKEFIPSPTEQSKLPGNVGIEKLPSTTVTSTAEEVKKQPSEIIASTSTIGGRKSEFTQIVSFKTDSLELSLYDNGEIDGDTVSVFMNGSVILSKQGLKSSAIRKTIYIPQGQEDFTLVLYAENLGKYPPNTGLLVVHDGEDVYNLRFSSDLQKNAGIIFKRKK